MGNFIKNTLNSAGIRINDDRGNPLNLPINRLAPTGVYRTFLPSNNPSSVVLPGEGFADPLSYITNDTPNRTPGLSGIPKQFGDNPQNISPNWNNNNIIYNDGILFDKYLDVYTKFGNNNQYNFVHTLDKDVDNTGQIRGNINQGAIANSTADNNPLKDIYLGSFVQTSHDNEDPTMFGYDIVINLNSSPLFNGAIIDFINQFGGGDEEIESRRDIWVTFCNQFFKFFSVDQKSLLPYDPSRYTSTVGGTVSSSLPSVNTQSSSTHPQKAYYLKKLSGLEKLVEGDVSANSETVKSMVDYGKDLIKLTLYEDVSVNSGYLSMLYKTLSWSRFNGKQVIPENLLRFDAQITITEIRDYNRVIKDVNSSSNLTVYADFLSRYTYNLYDCQFKFEKMTHGDEIDMWGTKASDDLDITFNYKYSTLRFDKFSFSGTQSQQYSIFNGQADVLNVNSKNSTVAQVNSNSLNTSIGTLPLNEFDYYPKNSSNDNFSFDDPTSQSGSGNIIDRLAADNAQSTIESYSKTWQSHLDSLANPSPLDVLSSKVINGAINEVNRQITIQARLLNNTLDNIRNSVGLGRMSAPTNVYYKNSPFRNDLNNAVRDFVGTSIRSFFTPPEEL